MQNKALISILLLLFTLFSCNESPQNVVAKTDNFINGPLTVSLEAVSSELKSIHLLELNFKITFPLDGELQAIDNSYGDFEFYEFSQSPKAMDSIERIAVNQQLILEPGLPGKHSLPALTFSIISLDGKITKVKTTPMTFIVNSVLPKNYDTENIQEIIELSTRIGPSKNWQWILPTLLIVIFLISFSLCPKTEKKNDTVKLDILAELIKLKSLSSQEIFHNMENIFLTFLNSHFSLSVNSLRKFSQEELKNSPVDKINNFIDDYQHARYSRSTTAALEILQQCEELVAKIKQGGAS